MTDGDLVPVETVRLLFEMTRDDNPTLYDDLQRFRKGTKRVNRLRLLAHEGLMAVTGRAAAGHPASVRGGGGGVGRAPPSRMSQALLTNQVFGLPSADGEQG